MTVPKKDQVAEGELAVKLTSDISGGLGNHAKGRKLRNLSISAFNTIVHGGFGEELKAGESAVNAEDAEELTTSPTVG